MQTVQPIRDMEKLNECYRVAREHDRKKQKNEVSWETLLMVGFNTSFRISDLQRLRVRDLVGKDYAEIRAKKTGKETKVLINPAAKREFKRIFSGRAENEYILESREKELYGGGRKPITRQRAYQIINEIAKRAGINDRIGCHTLRKTFGYHYYKMTDDVVSLQRILCHTNRSDTLRYIGVIQEDIDDSLKHFNILCGR